MFRFFKVLILGSLQALGVLLARKEFRKIQNQKLERARRILGLTSENCCLKEKVKALQEVTEQGWITMRDLKSQIKTYESQVAAQDKALILERQDYEALEAEYGEKADECKALANAQRGLMQRAEIAEEKLRRLRIILERE